MTGQRTDWTEERLGSGVTDYLSISESNFVSYYFFYLEMIIRML